MKQPHHILPVSVEECVDTYSRQYDAVGRALLGHRVWVLDPALPFALLKQPKAGTFLSTWVCSVPNTARHTMGPG